MTTEKVYEELTKEQVLVRLQDCLNHLQLERSTADEAMQKHYGYLQRGLIEAKRIIKEGQK